MGVKLPDANSLGARPQPQVLRRIGRVDGAAEAAQAQGWTGEAISDTAKLGYKIDAENQTNEARNALTAVELDVMHGPNGYTSLQGKNALDAQEKYAKRYEDESQKALAKISNPAARAAAAEIAASRSAQVRSSMDSHATRQREVYGEAVYDDTIATSRNRVAVDPTALESELRNTSIATLARAQRKGLDAEATLAANTTDLHGAVIEGMMGRGEYQNAAAYAQLNRKALGVKADEYAKSTAAGIEHAENAAERRLERTLRNDRVAAYQRLAQSDPEMSIDKVFTPAELAAMKSSKQPALIEKLREEQKRRLNGTETVTVPRVFNELRTMMGKNPALFASGEGKADITQYYDKLSTQDKDYFEKEQKEARNPAARVSWASDGEQVRLAYAAVDIPSGKSGEAARAAFDREFLLAKEQFAKDNKRTPTDADIKEILRPMKLRYMKLRRTDGWDKTITNKELTADAEVEVPAKQRAEIEAAAKRGGNTKRLPDTLAMDAYKLMTVDGMSADDAIAEALKESQYVETRRLDDGRRLGKKADGTAEFIK